MARVLSLGVRGIVGYLVTVEVDIGPGLPCFEVVGLPGAAVREARERVRAAISNSGFTFPVRRIVANLAPGDIPKAGALYDLPLAVGILAADGQVSGSLLDRWAFLGELSLDGLLRRVRGVLPMCLSLAGLGLRGAFVPKATAAEAASVPGIEVGGFCSLREVCQVLESGVLTSALAQPTGHGEETCGAGAARTNNMTVDLVEVEGQAAAKRALEIAAAGGHNILLVGPPGSGKTMLARTLPGVLPPLEAEERIEVSKVFSVAGLLAPGVGLVSERPFRSPHHNATPAGLAGGGSPPVPGEFSLAHRGVLFLDELPEFRREALELLRQPLEEGAIRLARKGETVVFPARFSLVAAMNPCPCGYLGDSRRVCRCSDAAVEAYRRRISGPLLDRIDMHIEVSRPQPATLVRGERERGGPASRLVRERVTVARARQAARLGPAGLRTNAEIGPALLRSQRFVGLTGEARRLVDHSVASMGLSLRARDRVIRMSRTIADLKDQDAVGPEDLAEALTHRGGAGRLA